jgi:arylsulfatase A-like enzyme
MKQNVFGRMIACLVMTSILASCVGTQNSPTPKENAPNIIVILTDDMDYSLLPYMENVNHLIVEQGATLTNYFVTASICCASRASMFRGQYPHNTDVLENFPGFRRFYKLNEEADTLAVWLKNAGYKTSLLGKYLNLYPIDAGRDYVPAGWTDWHAFIYQKNEPDLYENYSMNENGKFVQYPKTPAAYSTDVIKKDAVDFINESGKSPFFMLAAVYAPHGPGKFAKRHAKMFPDLKYPQKPSIGEDISDKPQIVQALASSASGEVLDAGDSSFVYIKRARALQAVDELVKDIVQTLEQNGELDNTYIIFTSDNGFHIGEHNLPTGKGTAYEEDIHVPFVIRGPGIQPNSQVTRIAANIDIAPTVADMAGASISSIVDGRSLLPLLKNQPVSKWRKALLVEVGYSEQPQSSELQNIALKKAVEEELVAEYPDTIYDDYFSKVEGGSFRAIRAENFVYVEYDNGEAEYYDLIKDPYQLDNLAAQLDADTLARLHAWLEELKTCSADNCRTVEEKTVDGIK